MSINQWKYLLQLKDSLSKMSNDKSFQNVITKDLFQFFQKLPTSAIDVIDNFSDHKSLKTSKDDSTAYNIPNVIESIKQKIGPATPEDPSKHQRPDWKANKTISKSSILSRTNHVLSSIVSAESDKSLLNRIEALILHIQQYPESRNSAVRNGAVRLLLLLRNRVKDEEIQGAIREALSLLGYFDPVPCQGIRILSIDGGGIRGILVLEMLKKLEELTGKRTHEMFDFFCGVSTGAILSFSIGLHRRDLDEIAKGYIAISKEIFQPSAMSAIWGTSNLVWTHSYYDTGLWEEKLKRYLGDMPLISTSRDPICPKMCAVSAVVNQSHLSAYIFRNYNLPWWVRSQYAGSSDLEVWQAARASAAAPTYFQEFQLGDFIHQDGGILVNNPTAIALHEAKLIWPNTPIQCVVSFGTGRTVPVPSTEARKSNNSSSTSWSNKFFKILDSATDTEGVHTMLNDLLPGSVYYRFNPYLTEMISMVEIRKEKHEQMKRDALMYLRRNEDKFHDAAKALTIKKPVTQRTKDWINLQREIFGV